MLSGTRANIALKIYGEDLGQLRALAEQLKKVTEQTPGAVDVAIEQQIDIPQLEIRADREALARYRMTSGELAEAVETAFAGQSVGTILEGQRAVELVVRLDDASRADLDSLQATPISTPSGARLAPILMTALAAGLALVPLVLAAGEPGNEIQAPMAVVILGGLLSATALNMLVLPVLYRRFAAS